MCPAGVVIRQVADGRVRPDRARSGTRVPTGEASHAPVAAATHGTAVASLNAEHSRAQV